MQAEFQSDAPTATGAVAPEGPNTETSSLEKHPVDSLAVGIAFAGLLIFLYWAVTSVSFEWSDFVAQYAGAKTIQSGRLYDYQEITRIETEHAHFLSAKPFVRPPFYAAIVWPLSNFSFRTALIVWQVVNAAALGGFLFLWPRSRLTAVTLCTWFIPTWDNVALAQDMFLVLLCIAAVAWLWRNERPLAAGLVLSLCCFKAHLFILVPVLIVTRRLWRTAWGVASGAAVLYVISSFVAGWNWPVIYIGALREASARIGSEKTMVNLAGLLASVPTPAWLRTIAAISIAAIAWVPMRRARLDMAFALALAGGLLVSPRAFLYDAVILLPALTQLAEHKWQSPLLSIVAGFGIGDILSASTIARWFSPVWVIALCITIWRACMTPQHAAPQKQPHRAECIARDDTQVTWDCS